MRLFLSIVQLKRASSACFKLSLRCSEASLDRKMTNHNNRCSPPCGESVPAQPHLAELEYTCTRDGERRLPERGG